jgi:CysZ protein
MNATAGTWAPGILTALGGGLLLYLAFSSLNLLIQLVASPFNDLLSERTEQALGEPRHQTSLRAFIRVFWLDLRKTFLAVSLYSALSILAFIPGLGLLCIPGFAMIQAFTFLTYPQSRQQHGVRMSIAWMLQNPSRTLGLGAACLILFALPVFNLFALPLCVMAGTLVYHRK